jgi:hypothetical protein
MRALDSNSKKPSTSTVLPVPKPAKGNGLGVQASRPHDVLRSHDSLTATHPGDKHEREADKAADTAMNNRPPSLKPDHAAQNSSSLPLTRAGAASGAPLEQNTRALMETRFGHDFSQVRVHTDEKATASARDMNARAYTVGNDIVFGKGQYHPTAASSERLIAHELAHVVQQRQTGQAAVARQLEYEENWKIITRANLEKNFPASYWEQKIMEVYALNYETDRLSNDPEERDAVLSALWARQPAPQFTSRQVVDVQIPARATTPIGKPLLYRFKFRPKDPAVPDDKPKVDVEFIAAGTDTMAIIPAKPPGLYSLGSHTYTPVDFPRAYPDYFATFPEEKKYLFHWIEKQAPAKFNQLLKVQTTTTKKKVTTTRETSFFVEGEKDKRGEVIWVRLRYMGTYQPVLQTVPTDYRAKDYADVLMERAQSTPDEVGKDVLGKVNIPTGISAEEAFAVKYYVTTYFEFYTEKDTGNKVRGTRNTEVDAIVNIPNKPTPVLYTFRFRANNDVDVERLGEVGTDAFQIDRNRLDIARVPEFADKAQDPKTFAAWLKTRYPTVPVAGATVEEMRNNFNTEAEAKADKPEWFKNYEIKVLNAADGKTRLKSVHAYKEGQTVDLKEFQPSELRLLEISLETMAGKILDLLKYTRMVRQRVAIEVQPDKTLKENPKWGGFALTTGTNKTVLIFDSGSGDPQRFIGGRAGSGVLPAPAELYTHELGHLVGSSAVQTKFEAFVAKHNIQPFTKYSKESVAEGKPREFFAEAFQMYQMDPEWMLTNHPLLHAWFDTLAKTGKPPVK